MRRSAGWLLLCAVGLNANADEKINFDNWSVLKFEKHENSPNYATSIGFDVDHDQRMWFSCSYRDDGFQAEFLKLKLTEYGENIHTNVEYSNGIELRKFYISPDAVGTDLFSTIYNLRFVQAVENWDKMTIKFTVYQDRKIKSVATRKIDLKSYNAARSEALKHCNQ